MAKYIYILLLSSLTYTSWGQANAELFDAELLSNQGQYLASNEILDDFIQANPYQLYDISSAWFLVSNNFLKLGKLSKSSAANEISIDLRNQLHSENLAENYLTKGLIYYEEGDYPEAMNFLFQAADLPTDDPMLSAKVNGAIAKVYVSLKDFEMALSYYQIALDVLAIELDENHIDIAKANFEIGHIYVGKGALEVAELKFKKSLKVALGSHRNLQLAGRAYCALGRIEKDKSVATDYFNKALDVYQRGIGRMHPEVAVVYLELGKLFMAHKNWAFAKKNIQQCIDIMDNPKSFSNSKEVTLEVAWAMMAKVNLEENGEDVASLSSALGQCEIAKGYFLERYDLALSDEGRLKLLQDARIIFDLGVYSAGRLYELTKDGAYISLAFSFMELPKMKDDYLGRNTLSLELPKHQELIAQNEEYLEQITLGEAILLENNKKTKVLEKLAFTKSKYRQFQMKMALNANVFFNKFYRKGSIDIKDIQAQLTKEEAVISYHCGSEFFTAILLTNQEEQLFVYPTSEREGTESLEQIIIHFGQAISDNKTKEIGKTGHLLYNMLLAPFKKLLDQKKSLTIIPDQYLSGIPFEVLIQKKPRRYKARKYDYIVRDFAVTYTTSASVGYDQTPVVDVKVENDFLLMMPNFENEDFAYIDERDSWLFDVSSNINPELKQISLDGERFSSLSNLFMGKLAEKLIDEKQATKTLRGTEATEGYFKKVAGSYKNIYLSTYSFASQSPMLSGIVFSTDYAEDNGVLYSKEIEALNLHADLVVITHHFGNISLGSNPLWMANNLIKGGADLVLLPTRIQSKEQHPFLELFNLQLLKGEKIDQSLQQIKKKMLKKKAFMPRDWAGYLLIK